LGRLDPLGSGEYKTHLGNDFRIPVGSNVYAVLDGKIENIKVNTEVDVTSSTGYRGYGLYIIIRHTDNSATLYGHLSSYIVSNGMQVKRGDIIAKSGGDPKDYPNAGGSTGPHLHLSYVQSGSVTDSKNYTNQINPLPCINGPAGAPTFPAGAPTFPAYP
jgi:murein DD-endopeptidase MepM/ murein hydrolase activator NlpD